nr:spore coat protein GerQ [Lysinibacillus timonensis]
MAYYYWNPNVQQQPFTPNTQFSNQNQPLNQTQQMTPPAISGGTTMSPSAAPSFLRGEESYIENILRLNRGKVGNFWFTVPTADAPGKEGNTVRVRGNIVEAGRDHAIIRELQTNHYFLFPMIYFDFAEFDEAITYLHQGSIVNPNTSTRQ